MFITNRYTMIYIPIFVNIVLLLLFGYRYLFFSLCSSVFSDHSADGLDSDENFEHPRIIDKEDAMPDGNHAESHKEAQEGTIDGVDDADTTGI